MGIRRVKLDTRRVVLACELVLTDKSGSEERVVIADPSVDLDKSDLKKYEESLYDTKYLVFDEDEGAPCYFTIRGLTQKQKIRSEEMKPLERAYFDWRCGLLDTQGYEIEEADGNITDMGKPTRKKTGDLGHMVTTGWMSKADPTQEWLHGLSVMIRKMSEASGPLSRRSKQPSGVTP